MSERCRALDDDGKRCHKSVGEFSYHGDDELYGWTSGNRPVWVLVSLCAKHKGSDVPHSVKMRK